jgi:hypothetical protein
MIGQDGPTPGPPRVISGMPMLEKRHWRSSDCGTACNILVMNSVLGIRYQDTYLKGDWVGARSKVTSLG